MTFRKTAICLAAAFCAALLLMPLGSSLADSTGPVLSKLTAVSAFCGRESEGADDLGAEEEPKASAETEAVNALAVTLAQGDTIVYDQSGSNIGTLQVSPADGTYAFLKKGFSTGESAKVVFHLPSDPSEEWLQSSTDWNTVPANLLLVAVRYGEGYENALSGWVDVAQVRNLTVILNLASTSLFHAEMEALRDEVQRSMQTPASTPLPSATPQNGGERMLEHIQELIKNPVTLIIFMGIIFVFLIIVLVVLTSNIQRVDKKIPNAQEREEEREDFLKKTPLSDISDAVSSLGKKADEHKEEHQVMNAKHDEFVQRIGEKEKPVPKDWDQLIEISKAEMDQTFFEDWKKAFLSKGWIPQAIRTPELNIPGEFEIAEINMSSDFAAFPAHDPEVKGVLYVIPSLANRDLRSGRTKNLFHIREGEIDSYEFYRVIKPALLHSTNDRFYTVQSKGEIQVRPQE